LIDGADVILSDLMRIGARVSRGPAVFLWLAVLLLAGQRARADISIEYGPGRDESTAVMATLFDRESTRDEWYSFQLHVGQIQRKREYSLRLEGATEAEIEEDGDEIERFPFYGVDLAVGHTSLNPYILLLLGGTYFEKIPHRLGTHENFHLGIEFGSHGPRFGWFLRLHHFSNGPRITGAPGPNDGEEFGTFGIEWRWQ
jgi:hypothetical protein